VNHEVSQLVMGDTWVTVRALSQFPALNSYLDEWITSKIQFQYEPYHFLSGSALISYASNFIMQFSLKR